MRHIVILFLITMLSLSGCSQKADGFSSDTLKLVLEISQAGLNQGKVILKSTLTNRLDSTVSYLPWGTSVDSGVNGRFLLIINRATGKELPYQGKMVKRRAPTVADYVALNSLDSIMRELDLSRSYNFCANSRYILGFSGEFIDSNHATLPIETQSIEFDTGSEFPSCL